MLSDDLRAAVLEAVRRGTDLAGPVIIGLDGRSGSGKTARAHELAHLISRAGQVVATVHLDDLYPGWSGLAAALPAVCEQVIVPLRSGRAARYRTWDWEKEAPGADRDVPACDVLIVEGVGTIASPCADLLDLRIWLEAPTTARRHRALERDGDVFRPHWDSWADQEDELLAPWTSHRPPADVVVDTAR